jgi:DNA-binding XRE family transcriptional regulator
MYTPNPSSLYTAVRVLGIEIDDVIDTTIPRPILYKERLKTKCGLKQELRENFSGAVFRKMRTEANISMERMSRLLDVHITAVSRYERGCSVPSIRMIDKMSAVLGVTPEDLMETDPPTPLPNWRTGLPWRTALARR